MMKHISALALLVTFAGAMLVTGCGSSASPVVPTPPSAPFSETDLVVGTGATATQGRTVTVLYNFWLYDPTKTDGKGTFIQGNPNFPFQLGVGSVIAGFDAGVVGMKVGGQRRLIIPPNLGYGAVVNGNIPANSTLVYDITLNAVN
jgi:FKBP-type peptidyl-prolyl cis-trans isomerase FkpA